MSASLKDTVKEFSNPYLIEQLFLHADQYTEEAVAFMKEELSQRGISQTDIEAELLRSKSEEAVTVVHYDKKEFTCLDGGFSTNDSILVRSMLTDHKIPFFVDSTSSLLPFDGEALDAHLVYFHVHNDSLEAARSAVAEHFELTDSKFTLKYGDTKGRLASFNFYEIPHALLESKEIVEVDFSQEEKKLLLAYARRLLSEVESVETSQQRVVFYYDALDDLITSLESAHAPDFIHADLLAILELLQIYRDDPSFSPIGSGIAEALMGFFSFSPHNG